jgi:Skp family chaperone for outer membrane proteins
MKKIIKIISICLISLNFISINAHADIAYFVDFKKVLNESSAGKNAQNYLKKKITAENKKFENQAKTLKTKETSLVAKKKMITSEEYKVEVNALRKEVTVLQKSRQTFLRKISEDRLNARTQLLDKLNPILKKYMEDNKIRLVIDKKNVLLGDSALEITTQIINILNKELKSLKLN